LHRSLFNKAVEFLSLTDNCFLFTRLEFRDFYVIL